jgi:hypothetical protein
MDEIASPSRENGFETALKAHKVASRRCKWCRGRIPRDKRPDAKFCCDAHKLANYRAQHDPANAPVRPPDQRKRKGTGISIYLSVAECRELAEGRVPESVRRKAAKKLKPADPLPGQLDILTALEAVDATRDA